MPSPWTWNEKSHRYHNTQTGRFLSANQMAPLRDAFVESQYSEVSRLADRVAGGDITLQQWVLDFRKVLKTTYFDEYAVARGGRNAMTQRDYGILGSQLKEQYKFLNAFAQDIADEKQSLLQVKARSALYINSATQAFERGKVSAYGSLKLPAYPGDGSSICRTNDRCTWEIKEFPDRWEAVWTLHPAEHCQTCLDRAGKWAPLVVKKAA